MVNIPETFYEEEERQKSLMRIFVKLKEIEEDKLMLGSGGTTNTTASTSFNKTVSTSMGSAGLFQSNT